MLGALSGTVRVCKMDKAASVAMMVIHEIGFEQS
jgi:hypothetical protein